MSEIKRIHSKRLLELVFVLYPETTATHHVSLQRLCAVFFSITSMTRMTLMQERFRSMNSTNQKAVQSKWTIIHLAGLKTNE